MIENLRGNLKRVLLPVLLVAGMAAVGFLMGWNLAAPRLAAAASEPSPNADTAALQAFATMDPIDTHVHVFKSDPAFAELLAQLRLHVLDICVADTHGISTASCPPNSHARRILSVRAPGHARLCVTFDPFTFQHKDFAENTVKHLHQEFAEGAIAVKIWKKYRHGAEDSRWQVRDARRSGV